MPRVVPKGWKGPRDVRKVRSNETFLGKGFHGHVETGRVTFKNGKTRRVAIKRFVYPPSTDKVNEYRRMIRTLHRAGVNVAKIGFVKIPTREKPKGEWVQITPLYGNAKGTRLLSFFDRNLTWDHKKNILMEACKLARAGVWFSIDCFHVTPQGQIVVIDIDNLVLSKKSAKEEKIPREIQNWRIMKEIIDTIHSMGDHTSQRNELMDIARNNLPPQLNRFLPKEKRE